MSKDNEQLKKMIEDKVSEHTNEKDKNFLPMQIAGQEEMLPVIAINTKYLILNLNNHRLTGQIKDLNNIEEVKSDPTSKEAQDLIRPQVRLPS